MILFVAMAALGTTTYEGVKQGKLIDHLLVDAFPEMAVLVSIASPPEAIITFTPSGVPREGIRVLVDIEQSWNGSVDSDQLYVVTEIESGMSGVGNRFLLMVTPRVGAAHYGSPTLTVLPYASWPAATDTVVINRRGNSFFVDDQDQIYSSGQRSPVCIEGDLLVSCESAINLNDMIGILPSTPYFAMPGVH